MSASNHSPWVACRSAVCYQVIEKIQPLVAAEKDIGTRVVVQRKGRVLWPSVGNVHPLNVCISYATSGLACVALGSQSLC